MPRALASDNLTVFRGQSSSDNFFPDPNSNGGGVLLSTLALETYNELIANGEPGGFTTAMAAMKEIRREFKSHGDLSSMSYTHTFEGSGLSFKTAYGISTPLLSTTINSPIAALYSLSNDNNYISPTAAEIQELGARRDVYVLESPISEFIVGAVSTQSHGFGRVAELVENIGGSAVPEGELLILGGIRVTRTIGLAEATSDVTPRSLIKLADDRMLFSERLGKPNDTYITTLQMSGNFMRFRNVMKHLEIKPPKSYKKPKC